MHFPVYYGNCPFFFFRRSYRNVQLSASWQYMFYHTHQFTGNPPHERGSSAHLFIWFDSSLHLFDICQKYVLYQGIDDIDHVPCQDTSRHIQQRVNTTYCRESIPHTAESNYHTLTRWRPGSAIVLQQQHRLGAITTLMTVYFQPHTSRNLHNVYQPRSGPLEQKSLGIYQ